LVNLELNNGAKHREYKTLDKTENIFNIARSLNSPFYIHFLNVAFLPYNEVITNYDNIFNLIIAFLFITISIWHFYQGIEVVLEDYIHNIIIRDITLKTLKYLCWILVISVCLSFIILYRF